MTQQQEIQIAGASFGCFIGCVAGITGWDQRRYIDVNSQGAGDHHGHVVNIVWEKRRFYIRHVALEHQCAIIIIISLTFTFFQD